MDGWVSGEASWAGRPQDQPQDVCRSLRGQGSQGQTTGAWATGDHGACYEEHAPLYRVDR